MLIDARRVASGSRLHFDVCIIGAGPAGISLAQRLAVSGLRVVLVEGGGFTPRVRDQRMFAGTVTGSPYADLQDVRFRVVGGSGSRWGGICRPLDPIDFRARDWVPDSGWPISYDEVARYYPAAAEALGVSDSDFTRLSPGLTDATPDLGGTGFERIHYRSSPMVDYGHAVRDRLERSRDITLLVNANVTRLLSTAVGDAVTGVDVRTFAGGAVAVTARTYVLAAGSVENARLLLVSDDAGPAGLGNRHDVVGRYFMEHVHVDIATLLPSRRTTDWLSYRTNAPHQPVLVSALSPSEEVQRDERIGSAAVTVAPSWYVTRRAFVGMHPRFTVPAERVYRGLSGTSERAAAAALDVARAAWNLREGKSAWPRREPTRTIYYRGEQGPARENRVVLGDRRDLLGHPVADLRWQVRDADLTGASAVLRRFAAAAATGGWGDVAVPDGDLRERIVGGPHHLGTTRMSRDPRTGVVDTDSRVHGVGNLYVAGGSVFPTGGHANPTLTVIALALRLGEHLVSRRMRDHLEVRPVTAGAGEVSTARSPRR